MWAQMEGWNREITTWRHRSPNSKGRPTESAVRGRKAGSSIGTPLVSMVGAFRSWISGFPTQRSYIFFCPTKILHSSMCFRASVCRCWWRLCFWFWGMHLWVWLCVTSGSFCLCCSWQTLLLHNNMNVMNKTQGNIYWLHMVWHMFLDWIGCQDEALASMYNAACFAQAWLPRGASTPLQPCSVTASLLSQKPWRNLRDTKHARTLNLNAWFKNSDRASGKSFWILEKSRKRKGQVMPLSLQVTPMLRWTCQRFESYSWSIHDYTARWDRMGVEIWNFSLQAWGILLLTFSYFLLSYSLSCLDGLLCACQHPWPQPWAMWPKRSLV